MILKNNIDLAWKVYNYFNIWGSRLFGISNSQSSTYTLIVTLIAYRHSCSRHDLAFILNISPNTLDLALTELEYHYHLLEQVGGVCQLATPFLKSLSYITTSNVGKNIFNIMLNNISKHIEIVKDNTECDTITEVLDLVSYLLDPLTGRHIPNDAVRKLSKLGYMKYKGKVVSLNELAYKRDWCNTYVV